MIPSSTKQGTSVAAFPDVCRTIVTGGPVPAPYLNIAGSSAGASKVAQKAQIHAQGGFRAADSVIPSGGSQVGAVGGVVSSKVNLHAAMSTGAAGAHLLRNKLNLLNQQLTSLTGRNPDHWHELVDEYVQVTASLYLTLAEANL